MSECGFMPQLACCRDCGAYEGDMFYLDVQEGHLLCADCAAKAGKSCNLDLGALYALRHICLVDDKKYLHSKSLWAAWQSFPQWQSTMRWSIWTSR